jgi:four helix bundle protein
MMRPHNFRELEIWQKARLLVKEIYEVSQNFPFSETYGLQGQSRRTAVSIVANIAEGSGKGTIKDFNNFLNMSRGSLFELQTLMILANDLGYVSEKSLEDLNDKFLELEKMFYSFQKKLSEPS